MISAIILTKNEEQMIENCIKTCLKVADEIVIVDHESTDATVEIAKKYTQNITTSSEPGFDKRREIGANKANGEWLLYVDADERVTPELAKEIKSLTKEKTTASAYIINRKDFYFGQPRPVYSPMHRLFKKTCLKGWRGEIHESPVVEGDIQTLTHPLYHFSHTDIDSMLINTMNWSTKEAKLRFDKNHPPVVWWRLIRVFITGFWDSFITKKGYTCGTAGWIEAIYQGCSLFLTYAKLWEMQNKDKIKSAYQKLDQRLINSKTFSQKE